MLISSVGINCANNLIDVKIIQSLLNINLAVNEKFTKLSVNGILGASTINAIKLYQKEILSIKNPEAIITKNGKVFGSLCYSAVKLYNSNLNDIARFFQLIAPSGNLMHNLALIIQKNVADFFRNLALIDSIVVTYKDDPDCKTKISDKSMRILKEMLFALGIERAIITSTQRTPEQQAKIMYNNLEDGAKSIYKPIGQTVVDVYKTSKKAGKNRSEIISDMTAKIKSYDGITQRVSRHCVPDDKYKEYNVFDVNPDPFLLAKKAEFEKILREYKKNGKITDFLTYNPPNENAFHIEIKQ